MSTSLAWLMAMIFRGRREPGVAHRRPLDTLHACISVPSTGLCFVSSQPPSQVMAQYGNAELVWCQEEPKNMGAWSYIKPRLDTAMRELGGPAGLEQRHLRYIGRTASASVGALVSPTCDARSRRQLALLRDSSRQSSVPSLHPARLLLNQQGCSHTCQVLQSQVRMPSSCKKGGQLCAQGV